MIKYRDLQRLSVGEIEKLVGRGTYVTSDKKVRFWIEPREDYVVSVTGTDSANPPEAPGDLLALSQRDIPVYDPMVHGAGDRVLKWDGDKYIETVIPEIG